MDDFLHRSLPLALVFEPHENHAEIRLAGAGKRRRHHRAERFHFRHGGDDFLRLLQLAVGEFARRAIRREHHAEHPAFVFQRQEILLQPFVGEKHGDHRAQRDHQHEDAMMQRPAKAAAIRIREPMVPALEPIEQRAVFDPFDRFEDARRHGWRQGQCHKRRDHHRSRNRHRELDEQSPRRALLKRQRRKDRHQRDRNGDDREADFLHGLERGLHRGHAFLDVPVNRFKHHDGVVHHDADAQHQGQHREDVHRVTEQIENRE